ncbi:MAG: Crp/Fnr family transcriptional regulator [Lachnospiraceae bacterium]|nr:Crp/Fnr family transcriptional regulator [Lachnospiraceae bacterium]
MEIAEFFPVWGELTKTEQDELLTNAVKKTVPAGVLIHDSNEECEGLILVTDGMLRAFITSPEGREVTLYRILPGQICLFSASCILRDIHFDITVQTEKETAYYLIPSHKFKRLSENSLVISRYINEIMSARFSDVMWLLEQIMWQSMDKRLAGFLLEEASLEGTDKLIITHEKIASHLGTAREVVTRILKYFAGEGLIELKRGEVDIIDRMSLEDLTL